MKLEVGKWYYFEIMGDKSFLRVLRDREYEYDVEHFVTFYGGKPEFKKEKSYINKTSKTLNSYKETNKKEIIEEIFK